MQKSIRRGRLEAGMDVLRDVSVQAGGWADDSREDERQGSAKSELQIGMPVSGARPGCPQVWENLPAHFTLGGGQGRKPASLQTF